VILALRGESEIVQCLDPQKPHPTLISTSSLINIPDQVFSYNDQFFGYTLIPFDHKEVKLYRWHQNDFQLWALLPQKERGEWQWGCVIGNEAVFYLRIPHGDDDYRDWIPSMFFVNLATPKTTREVNTGVGAHWHNVVSVFPWRGDLYVSGRITGMFLNRVGIDGVVKGSRFQLTSPVGRGPLQLQTFDADPTGVYGWWSNDKADSFILWRYDLTAPDAKPDVIFKCGTQVILQPQDWISPTASLGLLVAEFLPTELCAFVCAYAVPFSPLLFSSPSPIARNVGWD
jgi:hypothetical protein